MGLKTKKGQYKEDDEKGGKDHHPYKNRRGEETRATEPETIVVFCEQQLHDKVGNSKRR